MINDNKLKLGQLKICVEKHLPKHLNALNNLKDKSTSNSEFNKLRAAYLINFKWNKGDVITIGFMDNGKYIKRNTYDELSKTKDSEGNYLKVDPLQKDVDKMSIIEGVKAIVNQRIQPIVDLKFNFVDDFKTANVRISFDPEQGAWSFIGTQCKDPEHNGNATMNLGWFDVATTIHEFGHVLGLIHEHQNSNENPIKWDKDAVYAWAQSTQGWDKQTTDVNILNVYDKNQINGSVFDPLSIMLYFFPAELTLNKQGTEENVRLSGYDVQTINKMYPDSPKNPDNFYVSVYGETLQSNINLSTKMLNTKTNTKPIVKNNFYIYILIIGFLLLLVLLAINFSLKK